MKRSLVPLAVALNATLLIFAAWLLGNGPGPQSRQQILLDALILVTPLCSIVALLARSE